MKLLLFGLLALTILAALATAGGASGTGRAALDYFGAPPRWQPTLHVPVENYVGHTDHADNGLDSVTLCSGAGDTPPSARDGASYGRDISAPGAFGMRGSRIHDEGPDETAPTAPATAQRDAAGGYTEAQVNAIADAILARAAQPTAEGVADAAATAAAERGLGAAPNGVPAPLVPEGQRTPAPPTDGALPALTDQARSIQALPAVLRERAWDGDEAVYMQTARMLSAVFSRNHGAAETIQRDMAAAGYYRDLINGEVRDVATTGDAGQPFLPVVVSAQIERIAIEVGVVTRLCRIYDLTAGTLKVPNVPSMVPVAAVGEGAEIPLVDYVPGGISLDPLKWGGITDWTNEMSEEVGAQYVQNLIQAVGNGFGFAMDASVLTADGTGTYHGLTGILNDPDVPAHVLAEGKLMGDTSYDDVIDLEGSIAAGSRRNARSVFHPDFGLVTRKMKEDDGSRTFPPGTDMSEARIEFTEALPKRSEVAADDPFGASGDFSHVTIARARGLTVDRLTEATLKRGDGTLFSLAQRDAQALRFTMRWLPGYGLPQAFSRLVAGPAAA